MLKFKPKEERISFIDEDPETGHKIHFAPIADEKRILMLSRCTNDAAILKTTSEYLAAAVLSTEDIEFENEKGNPAEWHQLSDTYKTFFIESRIEKCPKFSDFAESFLTMKSKKKLFESFSNLLNSGNRPTVTDADTTQKKTTN